MTERTGKLAEGVLDIMKAQPLVLALLLVIFALLGFVYLQSSQFNTLLSQCIVPPPKG